MQLLHIHSQNPQLRLIKQAVEVINAGGVIVYPTDSAYALGCALGNVSAIERIRKIRNLDKNHNFTLVCHDLSAIATYAYVDNPTFRLLKATTPGPYTFILEASKEVPRRLQHPKRKTIGLRIPDNAIVQMLLQELDAPLMSVTLILSADKVPVADPNEVSELLEKQVDLIIDGGFCGIEPTTVVEFVSGKPNILREGKGDTAIFK
ncbi:MAG: L-threonylcarbamoyladenylate synthase [Gammaproteobacteria bacterium]|nr:L-threonylcarbamoyladenylate synthase [Gammaproteobacteria bacterium]